MEGREKNNFRVVKSDKHFISDKIKIKSIEINNIESMYPSNNVLRMAFCFYGFSFKNQ